MARLLSMPVGLYPSAAEPLSGPRAVGSAASTTIAGFVQTVASPFGGWRWQFSFPPSRDAKFRRYRGWITGLHAGANATRVPFGDPDMMSLLEAGVTAAPLQERFGMPWANDMPWANGANWSLTAPNVPVAAPAAFDASIVELADVAWGHRLGLGDYIGFFPFYFGMHTVTEVLDEGRYRIWPPLRKAMAVNDFATLYPTLAMKLESEGAASAARGLANAEPASVILAEVFDYDVRDYFTD